MLTIGEKYAWVDPENETSHVTTLLKIEGDICLCSDGTTELECNIQELRSLVSTLCCESCGNIDIQIEAWVFANTNSYVEDVDTGRGYCDICSTLLEPDGITKIETYLKNTNDE